MADELRPCPFCGQPDRAQHLPTCWFLLRDVGASAMRLVEAWNRRAAPSSPVGSEGGREGAAQTNAKPPETRMDTGFQPLSEVGAASSPVGDDGLPQPWEHHIAEYYNAPGSKQMHGTDYFKDKEIDEWRAWAARRAAGGDQ